MTKTLYIVATPIGNLNDITLRAQEILRKSKIIIAEDTRKTLKILNHLRIQKPLYSHHEHTTPQKTVSLLEMINSSESVAFVTDAGTPGISDPGGKIVELALSLGFLVVPIPGASALTAALSVYGKRVPGFTFIGYFPKKGKNSVLDRIRNSNVPVIFFESPHRIIKVLTTLLSEVGDREACVCRELTKKFETIYRGPLSSVIGQVKQKGEFVVIIEGNDGKK